MSWSLKPTTDQRLWCIIVVKGTGERLIAFLFLSSASASFSFLPARPPPPPPPPPPPTALQSVT
ncbi:hypothetical protein CGLO_17018 [Colletotrichum gloeosporioides Cg-14]|uniref:Uncharacterized protein n=1 Tax=Colletotrichum gloeosporioides (strain Cg-14) TaxID=1237896 RepID=T0JUL4_COLGC|nr:hypothetical protein CGLO_17018 [Colletotrichum gloeosporioides Cg-14]